MRNRSSTYTSLLELLFTIMQNSKRTAQYADEMNSNVYSKIDTGYTRQTIFQPLTVVAHEIVKEDYSYATKALIIDIMLELKENNALWICDRKIKTNTTTRKALGVLIDNKILIKTETTNIYIVNPFYIRRGNLFSVLTTTATILMNEAKVGIEHVCNKKAVKSFDFNKHYPDEQIGYGYVSDEIV